jgi:hypothetical protein
VTVSDSSERRRRRKTQAKVARVPRVAPEPVTLIEPPPPTDTADPQVKHVRGALELIGMVAAPTTIVTALAFFFGWTLTNARTSYFGIDPSTLGFTTTDYVLRSADAVFIPLGALVLLGLLAVVVHGRVRAARARGTHKRELRWAAWSAVGAGGALFAVGVVAAFRSPLWREHPVFPPACPGVGIALVAYGLHVLHQPDDSAQLTLAWRPSLATMLVALLVVLSAFWTASEYAKDLGGKRARELVERLDQRPRVEIYASRRLNLTADGVIEKRLPGADSAFRYSYSGLRLLVRSGGRYFLLPDDWSQKSGTTIVLRDTPGLRFEFGVGG